MTSLTAGFRGIPLSVRWGTLGNLLLFGGVAAFNAVVLPWIGASDSQFHLQYAEKLYNGELPPGSSTVAAHPPLYYALVAGLVGQFLAADAIPISAAIVRSLNILFGCGLVLVLAWAGWNLVRTRRAQFAIAVPGLSVLITPFVRVAGDVYNDTLATLLASSAIALSIALLRRGPQRRLVIVLAIVAVLGMATRSTFVVTFGLAMAAVVVAYLLHGTGTRRRRLGYGLGIAGAISAVVVATIGWFYLLNLERSGSWFRSRPQSPFAGRDYTSLGENLIDPNFYLVTVTRLLGFRDWAGFLPINGAVSAVISLVCLSGLIWWMLENSRWRSLFATAESRAVAALLVVQLAGVYAMQLQHATGWGNINLRYFLPGLAVFGIVLAAGSLAWPRLRGQLAVAVMAILAAGAVIDVAWFAAPKVDMVSTVNPLAYAPSAVAANAIPVFIVAILVLAMIAGLATVSASLLRATRPAPTARPAA